MAPSALDFSLFANGTRNERQKISLKLLEALSRYGHAELVGHGISDDVIEKTFDMGRVLFKLEKSELSAFANPPGPDPQRGWSRVGSENSAKLYRNGFLRTKLPEELTDVREHFDMGSKGDSRFPNRWPAESLIPGFRCHMETVFERMESVSLLIMSALEMALEVSPGSFEDKITRQNNASEMRLNHYPSIAKSELERGAVQRIWPHFDLGVITLLFQDGACGGLEFEDRANKGRFERVECSRREMVVNISETLQRWTNDVLPASLHRVNVPLDLAGEVEDKIVPERYSLAYFCKADRMTSVGPLEMFVDRNRGSEYEDITALEYHQRRLQSAY